MPVIKFAGMLRRRVALLLACFGISIAAADRMPTGNSWADYRAMLKSPADPTPKSMRGYPACSLP